MKKLIAVFMVLILISSMADAANRKGSHRAYSGHGKGSYYVGGHKK